MRENVVAMEEQVGSLEELEAFCRSAPAERRTSPVLRGILAEVATTGLLRYDWKHLQALVAFYLDKVLLDYEAEGEVEVGPKRPLPGGETPPMLRHRLKAQLADQFPDAAPFTIQRLSELLLEPHKHYARLDKVALALEKLISVTSTVSPVAEPKPRPKLKDLPPVNCNPRNPLDAASPQAVSQVDPRMASGQQPQGGDAGFGLTSSVLANSSRDPHNNRQGTPELEEGLGHLNEAGVAARAAPHGNPQDPAQAPLSPSRGNVSNGPPGPSQAPCST